MRTIKDSAQNLLSAQYGERRVTIGVDTPDELRRLSTARALTCPGCGSPLVLHAGTVRAHHFAHLPGAVCSAPQTEPETEEHRAGKLLLARWLRACLPDAQIIVEAHIPETNQRADLLVVLPPAASSNVGFPGAGVQGGKAADQRNAAQYQDSKPHPLVAPAELFPRLEQRIAIEYQCANMQAREWRRRHKLYRDANIQDLWLLGGSRLQRETSALASVSASNASAANALATNMPAENSPAERGNTTLRTSDLERGLLWDGAPLLFLDATGERMTAETLARFRPDPQAQAMRPSGRMSVRPLLTLPFPFALLAWPDATHPDAPLVREEERGKREREPAASLHPSSLQLWEWLAQRHRVTPHTLPGFFGLPVKQTEAFACEARAWQAALYYRFIHRRVGDRWWLAEVETWTRAYLPLAHPVHLKRLQSALAEYQETLAAAGFLSLPRGYNRVHATVTDDLTTLDAPPDPQETLRLARYRRTLAREARADYQANSH